jgi:hypothetical protein
MEDDIKVYAKINSNNVIVDINSSIFLADTTGYVMIDEGQGDKYSHAQGNYLTNGLLDNEGKYNYKLENGKAVLLTADEKTKLFPTSTTTQPNELDRIKSLEIAVKALMGV